MKCSLLRRGRLVAMTAAVAMGAGALSLAAALPAAASTAAPAQAAIQPAQAAIQPATRAAAPAWAHPIVLVNCRHHGVVLPRKYILTCADANNYLTRLRWVSWRTVAYGSGIEHINNCVPSCAAGHFHRFRVLITVWRPKRWKHHPGWFTFTRFTVIYTHRRPDHQLTATFRV
ncbi:MAG TPA: hypothetical protein VMV07_21975 [Streptosporangiaceae bacterium]|nr:hypothetical protein [Streptosporangiaceae bacterium]